MNILIDDNDFINIPFEEPSKYSFWQGFFLSLKLLLINPKEFYKKMHVNKGFHKPLLFALIVFSISTLISNIYMTIGIVDTPKEQMQKIINIFPNEQMIKMIDELPVYSFSFSLMINQIFSSIIGLFMLSGIWHLGMLILGIKGNGYQASFRIVFYASIVSLINLLPLNNLYIILFTYIWWFIIIFFGISEAHELTNKKSILSTIFPILLLIIIVLISV